jgi:hypothetical protein
MSANFLSSKMRKSCFCLRASSRSISEWVKSSKISTCVFAKYLSNSSQRGEETKSYLNQAGIRANRVNDCEEVFRFWGVDADAEVGLLSLYGIE